MQISRFVRGLKNILCGKKSNILSNNIRLSKYKIFQGFEQLHLIYRKKMNHNLIITGSKEPEITIISLVMVGIQL